MLHLQLNIFSFLKKAEAYGSVFPNWYKIGVYIQAISLE